MTRLAFGDAWVAIISDVTIDENVSLANVLRSTFAGRRAMKLMWFHLMPYTELPDDFREKNPSVWVDIHSSLFDPRRAHHMYNDFMDELEYAAECGFDAICVNEHHSNGYGLMPSPNLVASSLARRTTDTALCVLGNSLALYNPPTRVAEEFA